MFERPHGLNNSFIKFSSCCVVALGTKTIYCIVLYLYVYLYFAIRHITTRVFTRLTKVAVYISIRYSSNSTTAKLIPIADRLNDCLKGFGHRIRNRPNVNRAQRLPHNNKSVVTRRPREGRLLDVAYSLNILPHPHSCGVDFGMW